MIGETLEQRMLRKEKVSQVDISTVEVPKDVKDRMQYPAEQYVLIATGYGHGELKYEFHRQLCDVIFDHLFPDSDQKGYEYRSTDIHDETLDVVDFLDETIGLPLRELTAREITLYANKLIRRLWVDLEKYRECTRSEQ